MSKNFVSYQDALSIFSEYAEEINKSIKKFSVMPNYTNFDLGTIIQYVGVNTGEYINGYFYERTASGWVQKNTQPTASGLGTAAFLDVAESGDAAANEVVKGNDSRLSDSRPASDVPSWAKQSTKPTYNKSEVGLANVDNTSDATKKTNFTGNIADGNTGFATGGDVYTALNDKVDKVTGKGLSTNDYTDEDKEKVDKIDVLSTSVSGNPLSFTTKSAQLANNAEIVLEPIQAGTGDPSPTNMRAISGYNEIKINGCGKNLFDNSKILVGNITSTGAWFFPASTNKALDVIFAPNTQYTFSGSETQDIANARVRLKVYYTDGSSESLFNIESTEKTSFVKTSASGKSIDRINVSYGSSIGSCTIEDFKIELGSQATPYEPYNPATDITLKLNETVYGGKLNVRTGELVVDSVYKKFDGSENWEWYAASNSVTLADAVKNRKNNSSTYKLFGVSNMAPTSQDGSMENIIRASGLGAATLQIVQIGTNFGITDVSLNGWKTWLSTHNLEFTYELADEYKRIIQLTPHEILLLGNNVVTTNGTTINLDYNANGEMASLDDLSGVGESVNALSDIVADNIEIKANKTDIAYVESGTTASRAYSEGDLVYVGGVLYKVLTAIPSGQSFTIGTNVTVMSVDMRLKEINTQLQSVTGNDPVDITSRLNNLSAAIAEQNLKKYGYKIGDYFTGASGYRYNIADLDTFYGGYNNRVTVDAHHVGVVVDALANSKWNETADISNVNYKDSTLHTFLSTTALNNIKSDLIALFGSWESHLIKHDKLYAKIGGWAWSSSDTQSEYIAALTECQIYGSPIWSADNYQQGEGDRQLELFRRHTWMRVFGSTSIWLRSISTASNACYANASGYASHNTVTYSYRAAGLILFK